MNAAERAEAEKREAQAREEERKERAPTVGGSLKAGVQRALSAGMRAGAGGGMADTSRAAEERKTSATKKEIKEIEAQ